MMQLDQDVNVARTIFLSACEKREIPLYNKSVALYTMLEQLSENPDDAELRELLLAACADNEILITQFASYPGDAADAPYCEVKKDYEKLVAAYAEQENLEDTFSDYASDEQRITVDTTGWNDEDDPCVREARSVAAVMQTCMVPKLELTDTLLGNLYGVLKAVRGDGFLKRCLPLILYLLIREKEHALMTEEKFSFSCSEIFSYREFDISVRKQKYVKQLKAYTKLFRKLCKLYKKEEGIDKKQCRYGFFATSNLTYFALEEEFDKCKKLCPPFLYELIYMDVSCQESEEPDQWDAQHLFGVSDELLEEYYDYEGDTPYQECNADDAATAYIRAHQDVLLPFMKTVYHDRDALIGIVNDVMEKAVAKDQACRRFADAVRMEVYMMLLQELDSFIEQKLYRVCMQ